jgi:hypothetical protein
LSINLFKSRDVVHIDLLIEANCDSMTHVVVSGGVSLDWTGQRMRQSTLGFSDQDDSIGARSRPSSWYLVRRPASPCLGALGSCFQLILSGGNWD